MSNSYLPYRWLVLGLLLLLQVSGKVDADDVVLQEQQAMQFALQRVDPSVVQIQTLGGMESVNGQLTNQAPTSGIIVSEDGYILSSAINFAQEPSSILVRLPNAKQYPAQIVARDQLRMLVLLKIHSEDPLPLPEIVPRESVRVGQWALAVGRSLETNALNVSVGIVSATHRIWGRAIQTDAKVSPLNYGGPLIDIHGRIIGILVPLSPDSDSVAAGTELYDSGIGFAVPLSDLIPEQLARMRTGEDLKPGLLGIHLKGQNIYTDRAVIGFCSPKSPAREIGLAPEDEIIQVDGQPVTRQVHLRQALGRKMAGDAIALRVRRGDRELSFSAQLVATIEPYDLPFLGILPSRDDAQGTGIVVEFVYPDSPAAKSGLLPGDRLRSLDGQPLDGIAAWREALGQQEPASTVVVAFSRGHQEDQREVTLSTTPTDAPTEIPVRRPPGQTDADERPAEGRWSEIRLADEPNECLIWEPASGGHHHGLLVWILPPGKIDQAQFAKTWGPWCERWGFVLALPRPRNESAWEFSEIETIRKLLESTVAKYQIDPFRVVVGGYQAGGSLAAAYAFLNRERIRGVALVDAALPPRVQPRGNDPESRLEFFQGRFEHSRIAASMVRDRDRLREMRFPIVDLELASEPVPPDDDLAEQIVRWSDTLDRL